jgi:uridine phosphorylase
MLRLQFIPRDQERPMALQYHLQIDDGDVAPCVLLPGDPGRVPFVAGFWDEAREVARNREYVTYTGQYKGAPISCTSTGIGAPSTAIALEELARVGATTFIRIGTCGTFQERVAVGDIAVFDSAMRYDGASLLYAPAEFPAVAHHEVLRACMDAGDALGYRYHVGTTRSADSFYARHSRPGSSFNDFWQSDWREHFEDLRRLNVLAAEMEASIIFVLARVWGLRAGGISVVVDNVLKVGGESGKFDPEQGFDHSRQNVERLARMGSEIVRLLTERDRPKP